LRYEAFTAGSGEECSTGYGEDPMKKQSGVRRFLCVSLAFLCGLTGAASAVRAQQAQPTISKIEVEILRLGKSGCAPAQVQRPQGQFRLLVINQTGVPNPQFTLQAVGAQSAVAAKQFSSADGRWIEMLNLSSGQYTITSPALGKVSCSIVIK
jgi:hypothetical protein